MEDQLYIWWKVSVYNIQIYWEKTQLNTKKTNNPIKNGYGSEQKFSKEEIPTSG